MLIRTDGHDPTGRKFFDTPTRRTFAAAFDEEITQQSVAQLPSGYVTVLLDELSTALGGAAHRQDHLDECLDSDGDP